MLSPAKNRFIAIARIIKPQGRRGEVSSEILTDFPERFGKLGKVFLADPRSDSHAEPRAVVLEKAWLHKDRVVLKLAGVDSIGQADSLREFGVMIPYEERIRLPTGSYYTAELEGCRVMTAPPGAGFEIGTVTAVEPTGGVPLLRVTPHADEGRSNEILIPLAQEICREINTETGLIVIDPPGDLLDLNSANARSRK